MEAPGTELYTALETAMEELLKAWCSGTWKVKNVWLGTPLLKWMTILRTRGEVVLSRFQSGQDWFGVRNSGEGSEPEQ